MKNWYIYKNWPERQYAGDKRHSDRIVGQDQGRVFLRQLNHKESQFHKKEIPEEINHYQKICHCQWAMEADFQEGSK